MPYEQRVVIDTGIRIVTIHATVVLGVDFLSLVLGRCPAEKLNNQSGTDINYAIDVLLDMFGMQVRVLASFYCGKLDDTETIIPALKGLATLTALPTFSSTDATSVVQA
jgi:DNA repair/transcription protein MET18/MMS19